VHQFEGKISHLIPSYSHQLCIIYLLYEVHVKYAEDDGGFSIEIGTIGPLKDRKESVTYCSILNVGLYIYCIWNTYEEKVRSHSIFTDFQVDDHMSCI